jgi:hypothetical protein
LGKIVPDRKEFPTRKSVTPGCRNDTQLSISGGQTSEPNVAVSGSSHWGPAPLAIRPCNHVVVDGRWGVLIAKESPAKLKRRSGLTIMKTPLTIGPHFLSACGAAPGCNQVVVPLRVSVEWAHAQAAVGIPLFRHRPRYASDRLRLEHVIFRRTELPFDLACSQYQVVESPLGTYLPLESLLVGLYRKYEPARCIFSVLSELASLLPLHNSVLLPDAGLLVPQAELREFRLNTLILERGCLYAEIGWRPANEIYLFHTSICAFRATRDGGIDAGHWKPPVLVGVAELLANKLRQLVPGAPETLFTSLGRSLLQDRAHQKRRAKTHSNKICYEFVKPGFYNTL